MTFYLNLSSSSKNAFFIPLQIVSYVILWLEQSINNNLDIFTEWLKKIRCWPVIDMWEHWRKMLTDMTHFTGKKYSHSFQQTLNPFYQLQGYMYQILLK